MKFYTLPGYYTETSAKNLQEKLTGKTYMNFQVSNSSQAGNHSITVSTDYKCTNKDFQEMVIFYIASNI